jgi:hypothetical protein
MTDAAQDSGEISQRLVPLRNVPPHPPILLWSMVGGRMAPATSAMTAAAHCNSVRTGEERATPCLSESTRTLSEPAVSSCGHVALALQTGMQLPQKSQPPQ